ncbi:MAG TPA: anti-sigma factor [Streptosporangiaceae bacterium]|jgi:anti-sigma-K factor RskA
MRLRRTDPHTLAGAYALDALGDVDREKFERHLGVCEACRAEATSLRDAAGRLAEATAAMPPPRLRGQVLAEAARTRQQPPVRVAERVRRSWHGVGWSAAPRMAVAVAGVGILVALALGTLLINDQHQLHMYAAQRGQIAAILNAPDADIMTVAAQPHGSATVVMSHAAHALVLTTARLPALPSSECYQVWVMGTHRMRSAGRLPSPKLGMTAPMVVAGIAPGDRMGVTVEPSGGSQHPTSPPLLMLALPAD